MANFKKYLIFLINPTIAVILFFPNLNDFFISDDFVYLIYANFFGIWANPWLNIQPFATLIFGVEFSVFKFEPLGYHMINLSIHIFNSYLLFFVINELTENEKSGIIGSLLFITFPLFSEPIIWISAQFDLWMTAFILLSFFFYLKYYRQKKSIWIIFSLLYFTCALFCKEIAAVFFIVYFCYDFLNDKDLIKYFKEQTEYKERVKKIGKYCVKYLIYLAIVIIYSIFFVVNKSINLNSSFYYKFSYFIDFIPNSFIPLFLDKSDVYMILFVISFFALIFSFYFVFSKGQNKVLSFSVCWILILVACFAIFNLTGIDIYFYLILFNINTGPQGRFLYIIGVGVAIFYSVILTSLYEKNINMRWKIPISRNLAFFALIIFLLIGNSLLIFSQHENWNRSSRITNNILLKTLATVPIGTRNVKLYYINVPESIQTPFSPSYSTAFVVRNGLQEMARIFYPDGKIFCLNMYWHKKILDFNLADWSFPIGLNEFNQLSNDSSNVILYFNPITELLINVSGLNYSEFDPFPYLGIPKLEFWFN
ncbi:MAG: hypothetical protein ACTSRG_09675 [Candidatus Helarchaeota archaeon]